MNLALTCSHVRFSRRIGGVLRPEITAVIVEKFCKTRQRCVKQIVSSVGSRRYDNTYVSNIDEVFHYPCSLLRILPGQDRLSNPVSNLYSAVSVISFVIIRSLHTLLLNWMIVVMLSGVFPGLASRERCKHSIGRIFLYRAASMRVSCRPNSSGSMSSSLIFLLDFGSMGAGGASGTVLVVLIGASPPRCYCCHVSIVHIV